MDTTFLATLNSQVKFELSLIAVLLAIFLYSIIYMVIQSYLDTRCTRMQTKARRDRYAVHPYGRKLAKQPSRVAVFLKWYFRKLGI